MSVRTILVSMAVVAITGILGLLAWAVLSEGDTAIAIGDVAPDKTLPALDGSGEGSLADYKGQWVLVNFWASWCPPCRDEAPALEAFHKRNSGPNFTVLGVALDDNTDDASGFVSEFGLTFPQLRDGDGRERRDAYGMTGFPESFLVDPQGRLALIHRGQVTEEFLDEKVAPLINVRGAAK
jgi:cytochrome c biogenesis protein CcmG/thiol:disulfide interchange protein DsbE